MLWLASDAGCQFVCLLFLLAVISMSRIVIVEDALRVAEFIEKGLRANGFSTTIIDNGDDAIALSLNQDFDLMILDLGLPQMNGFTVLEQLRGQGITMPIIILSARHEVDDKVTSFELGADDYLTKPFRFEELLMRIRARLREISSYQPEPAISYMMSFREIKLNLRSREVRVGDRLIKISTKEFILLETFIRHAGQILSREQLLDHVWGYDYDPGSNIVDVYVGYLRKKLGRTFIETVRGMGYRLKNK